jgi:olfactory receptor
MMTQSNKVTEFILLRLTQDPDVWKALFTLFLLTYIETLMGNLLIVVSVIVSPSLGSTYTLFLPLCDFLMLFITLLSQRSWL